MSKVTKQQIRNFISNRERMGSVMDLVHDAVNHFCQEQMSNAFDQGFNISNERFNAEFRDDYQTWDQHDFVNYEIIKQEKLSQS